MSRGGGSGSSFISESGACNIISIINFIKSSNKMFLMKCFNRNFVENKFTSFDFEFYLIILNTDIILCMPYSKSLKKCQMLEFEFCYA